MVCVELTPTLQSNLYPRTFDTYVTLHPPPPSSLHIKWNPTCVQKPKLYVTSEHVRTCDCEPEQFTLQFQHHQWTSSLFIWFSLSYLGFLLNWAPVSDCVSTEFSGLETSGSLVPPACCCTGSLHWSYHCFLAINRCWKMKACEKQSTVTALGWR